MQCEDLLEYHRVKNETKRKNENHRNCNTRRIEETTDMVQACELYGQGRLPRMTMKWQLQKKGKEEDPKHGLECWKSNEYRNLQEG